MSERAPESVDTAAERLQTLLTAVVDALRLDAEVTVERGDGVVVGRLVGEGLGRFIGRRGQTINAVQHLAQLSVLREGAGDLRVVVDAGDYRARRAQALRAIADDAAEQAERSGRAVELEPMPAVERRLVHEHLRERVGVETYSEGAEPERYLVVAPLAG
jgi:spoIIIJ-associated protein